MEENGRVLGTVQWFSRVKGYGFIRPDGNEEDVFIHYSLIRGEGYRNLNRGQRVEFVMEDTPKGPQAVDVLGLETELELESEGDVVEFETEPQLGLGEVELESEGDVVAFEAEPELGLGDVEPESAVDVVEFETEPQLGLGEVELESEGDVVAFEAEPELGLGDVEPESAVGAVEFETEPQLGLAEAEL